MELLKVLVHQRRALVITIGCMGIILVHVADAFHPFSPYLHSVVNAGVFLLAVVFFLALKSVNEAKERYKEMQLDLRQQRGFLEHVIESIPHPFYVISTGDFSLALTNSLARNGAEPTAELYRDTCFALAEKTGRPCRQNGNLCPLEVVKSTKKAAIVEHTQRGVDGNSRVLEVHGAPVFDQTGEVVQMIEYAVDITEKKLFQKELADKVKQLESVLNRVRHLEGIIPICMYCKRIRDDRNKWQQLELYISMHSEAHFSHGICPECKRKWSVECEKPS